MYRGYVRFWRKMKDWSLYGDTLAFRIFSHFLLTATHQPLKKCVRGRFIELQPGQCWYTQKELSEALGLSRKEIRNGISKLSEEGAIRAERVAKLFTVVTILHWDTYAGNGEVLGPSEGPSRGQVGAKYGPSRGQQNKNIEEQEEQETQKTPPKSPQGDAVGPSLVQVHEIGLKMLEAWNAHAELHKPKLKTTQWLTAGREQVLRDSFEQIPQFDSHWYQALQKTPVAKNLGGGWQPTFDWMLDVGNIRKLLDGNYDQPERELY